ncbi:MAG: TetR family transcriptional regulator C-terminal domain-containing protein [Hyphomonadaceae bacterium]|nr:TetR family transcriptional regulator C-terminal domain-containing protein [Hyphomonadaceae bacterium]
MARPNTHAEINEYRLNALINGAIECVAREGLKGASVRTIADAAGTSRGLIGHYFNDRETLLVQAHKRLCNRISDIVVRKLANPSLTVRERLYLMPATIFSSSVLTEINAKAFLAFWHAAATCDDIRKNHEVLYTTYRQEVASLYQQANEAGARVADPVLAGYTLIALIDGFWIQLSIEKAITRKKAIKACQEAIELQLAGLGKDDHD